MRFKIWNDVDIKKIELWYSQDKVKDTIVNHTTRREFVLLTHRSFGEEYKKRNTRMLKCDSRKNISYLLDKGLKMFSRRTPFSFFYSLATFRRGIPFYPVHDLGKRDFSGFFKDIQKEIVAYDLLIDIDAPTRDDIMYAHEVMQQVHQELMYEGLPHEVIFSGKGFHIKVPFDVMFDGDYSVNKIVYQFTSGDWSKLIDQYSLLSKRLHEEYGDLIDTSVYDLRRICKIPNTLAVYPDAVLVCAPLNDEPTLRNFNIEDYYLDEWRSEIVSPKLHLSKEE